MSRFQIAADEDQTRLGVGKVVRDAFDLEPYKAAVNKLRAPSVQVGDGYSKWARVELTESENAKTERRRFSSAAKKLGTYLQYAKDENPRVLWFRVRPEPIRRVKADGAVDQPSQGEQKAA